MISYCILCREPIPEKRARRGAISCCSEHGQEYRRQRRAERATKFCRLCGRKARRPKVESKATDHTLVEPTDVVLGEHADRGEQHEPNL